MRPHPPLGAWHARARTSMAVKRSCWKSFLCLFVQEHSDFRLQELQSLVSWTGSEVRYDHTSYSNKNPHLIIQLESESTARQILSRSLLLRSMFELWGWGRDYVELESSIQANMSDDLMEPYTKDDYTFKLVGSGFSRKCSQERQKMIFEKLSFLPINGKVNLKDPHHIFHVLEDYGDFPNSAPMEPVRVFFGRLIGHGQRNLIQRYSLTTRHFIGNTSMDALLSFLMANQAKVTSGDLVLDPFAGSGSVLVSCAHFGAHVVGADIDWNIVHGRGCTSRAGTASRERGRDENVCANLRQYGLEGKYVDMLIADAATSVWRDQELFNAIVTDPPYGIREGGRKIGAKSKEPKSIPPEHMENHIPEFRSYKLSELFVDLVKFAAQFLVVGGRLVYWVPVVNIELLSLPRHPCMCLVSSSMQPLQRHVGRRLITMEKCLSWREHKLRLQERHVSEHQVVQDKEQEQLKGHDNFRDKYFNEEWYT